MKRIHKLALLALLAALPTWAAARAEGVLAITEPSGNVTLSFPHPGLLAKVLIKEGDLVKTDQVVVQQDCREEAAAAAAAKAEADDQTEIKLEEALVEQKKIDYAKAKWAYERGAKSQFELDDARVQLLVEEARLTMSHFKHDQADLKYQQAKVIVDKASMRSPFDGRIEKILVKAGESVELNTKVLRIINLDPLRIETPVPLAQARTLKEGQPAKVAFPADQTIRDGKISFISGDADAASGTLRVTVEVPNPQLRQTGEQVTDSFPPAPLAAAETPQP